MWVFNAVPDKMIMVYAMVLGTHLLLLLANFAADCVKNACLVCNKIMLENPHANPMWTGSKLILRRLLFEEKQHFGDCMLTGRLAKNTITQNLPMLQSTIIGEIYNKKIDYIIRLEKKEEFRQVENLVRESFWNVYRPGCLEHYVLNQLRNLIKIFLLRKSLYSFL